MSSKRLKICFFTIMLMSLSLPGLTQVEGPNAEKSAAIHASQAEAANMDIRVNGGEDLDRLIQERSNGRFSNRQGAATNGRMNVDDSLAALRASIPGVRVTLSPLQGGAELVAVPGGTLSGGDTARDGRAIALDFLYQRAEVFGLTPSQVDRLVYRGESKSPANGLRMVRFSQELGGLPVFQSDTRALVDKNGRLVRIVGRLAPGLDENDLDLDPAIGPADALAAVAGTLGIELESKGMNFHSEGPGDRSGSLETNSPQITQPVSADLVLFPLAHGVMTTAWRLLVTSNGNADWYLVVDATDGSLLYRKNVRNAASTEEARFSVYAQPGLSRPADSPAPQSPSPSVPGVPQQYTEIARSILNMSTTQDIVASPNGWIPDGGNTTTGNNVDAYLDRDGNDLPDAGALDLNGRPIGNPDAFGNNRDFLGAGFGYNPAPLGGNPNAGDNPSATDDFKRGVVTHLFYLSNWYHDQMFSFGFDEAAGNFQAVNFSGMGAGNDHVRAEAQQSAGAAQPSFNNANFSTWPDGVLPGLMRMYLFNFPNPDRDGSLDAEIVIHELTHGLSNRLVGDAAGLNWWQGRGMGEGWSDFYAMALLNNSASDNPDANYASGAYATYNLGGLQENYLYGIRRFPYTTDNTVNPLTFADVDDATDNMSGGIAPSPLGFQFAGASEVHNSGEIWTLCLWEMRSRIIANNGGNVATGNAISLQLVTDGLKMTPIDPTFVDARDAILDADCATNGCANEDAIWAGFADRGMGYGASASSGVSAHYGVSESFSSPYLDAAGVSINDAFPNGNGNGWIDPGETVTLTLTLANPWRGAAKGVASATASLSSTTPEITVVDASAAFGAIAAQGSTVAGDTFSFSVSPAATCGQSLFFDVQTTSSLGTTTASFTLRLGMPNGTLAPVTYTRSTGGLAIPDGSMGGLSDSLLVNDDYEIADLDVRIDNMTHTWVGDLTMAFREPAGFGSDMLYRIAGTSGQVGGNQANNFVNTRFDDGSVSDLLVAPEFQAPYTGSWQPVLNSPNWTFPDPVPILGNFNGRSTQGTWWVHVADHVQQDVGTLNAWSLIVTPVDYQCSPFVPSNDIWVDLGGAGNFTDIQSAVNAATAGNNIHVVQGVYTTASGNIVDWQNKDLTIIGGYDMVSGNNDPNLYPTIIDAGGVAFRSCVYTANLTNASTFTGFTLRNGQNGHLNGGAGIHNENSDLNITYCTFHSNYANWGAGISNLNDSDVTITHCLFFKNEAYYGAGVHNGGGSEATVINSVFYNNKATYGGAMRNVSSDSLTINCSFGGNSGTVGNTVHNRFSSPTIRNAILWNGGNEISDNDGQVTSVFFSDVQGGFAGAGNINADPLYTSVGTGDLTLLFGSPAINSAGSFLAPADDFLGVTRPQGWFFDMGAYEKLVPFMISPQPRSQFPGTTVTFTWTANTAPVTAFGLQIGTTGTGSSDLYSRKQGAATSVVIPGLPTGGIRIYVRFWYHISGTWYFTDYVYQSAP